LQLLVKRCFISADDARTWAELFALFDPFYVSYDKSRTVCLSPFSQFCLLRVLGILSAVSVLTRLSSDSDSYEDLSKVSERIFSLSTHREKQSEEAAEMLQRPLLPAERNYLTTAATLVEGSSLSSIFLPYRTSSRFRFCLFSPAPSGFAKLF
jgi:hypothetical protein